MRRNNGIIGPKQDTTTSSAIGTFDLFDQYNLKTDDKWPPTQKVLSISNDNGTNLNENVNNTFTATTSGISDGTTLYYTIVTVSGTALVSADFNSESLSGSFSISSNSGSFSVRPIGDDLSESNVAKIQIRRGSITGDILIETGNLTIADADAPIGTDISSSFYEISNRFIASNTYMGNNNDYNGPYDVGQVQTDFSGSGRVYIGVKVTAATTYYNDIPIAGVQIISGSTLVASWIFNTSSGGSGSGWQTHTSQIIGSSTHEFPVSPSTAAGYTYSSMSSSSGTGKFSFTSSTGSSATGAADGIGNTYKLTADGGSNTLATVGDAQISQTSLTYYAYRETSGSTRYSGTVMRSPAYTFSGGEYIRVIHAVTGPSSVAMDPDDSVYVAVY